MAEDSSPLSEGDFTELTANLAKLDQAEREMERASRAGIDMSGQKVQMRELREKLTKVKQSYFPGR